MLGVFAEFETRLRQERQREGIARAKAKGAYKGRKPTAQAKTQQVIELTMAGLTREAVAGQLSIESQRLPDIKSLAPATSWRHSAR